MNIEIQRGDLLKAPAEALVNTVNCVGVMGKGIALQFDRTFPQNTKVYKAACKAGTLRPGDLLTVEMQLQLENQIPRFIVNFATKDHWKAPSKIEWIHAGLMALKSEIQARGIASIAIPPLGCGNGGLDWNEVRPLIEATFADLPDVHVLLFPPEGAPDAATMAPPSKAPNITHLSALTIELLEQYSFIDLEFSQLEVQKLTYLLRAAGEPMPRLHFEQMQFGPAARTIPNQLSRWENHWIVGFGDGTSGIRKPMLLKPEAIEAAHAYREANPSSQSDSHVRRVIELIEGLDTALGLELLASVHWAARHHPEAAHDVDEATDFVHQWNERKKKAFSSEHIALAWNRLRERGWLENLRPEWMSAFEVEVSKIDELTRFVNQRPDLKRILPEAAQQLHLFFPKAVLWLELWHNPDAARNELSLQIESHLSSAQRASKLEQFDQKWWLEHAARWQGTFSIGLM